MVAIVSTQSTGFITSLFYMLGPELVYKHVLLYSCLKAIRNWIPGPEVKWGFTWPLIDPLVEDKFQSKPYTFPCHFFQFQTKIPNSMGTLISVARYPDELCSLVSKWREKYGYSIIYVTSCCTCDLQYVGQTGTAKMNESEDTFMI